MTPRARSADPPGGLAEPAAALVIYAIASFAFFGIPLLGDFCHLGLGFGAGGDTQIPIWGLAWYPYALSHRLNPLFTDAAWAPAGCTLAWSTTIPGAALLMWPVTRWLGMIASYNILCLSTPALSAFTAFLLCRRVTCEFRAALAGGFIFGFSTYVASELLDHVSLAMVFLVPLFPYLSLAFLDREMEHGFGRAKFTLNAKFILALTALVIGQFLLSPEILATATLFGGVAIVLALRLFDETLRRRLRSLAGISAISYGISALVLAPYLARLFPSPFGLAPIYNPSHCSSDLLNFITPVEPSMLSRLPPIRRLLQHTTWGCEPSAYLGLLPLIVILSAAGRPRTPRARLLIAMLLIVAVATLGPVLHLGGRALLPLPWLVAMLVPLLDNALPARFTVYLFLILAVIVALWLARREGFTAGRWLLGGAALVSIFPSLPMTRYTGGDNLPAFFENGLYRQYLAANEIVLILPFGASGDALLWQAEANFYFRIPQGRLLANAIPSGFARWPIVQGLANDDPYIPGYATQFPAFLVNHDIRTVIVNPAGEKDFARLFDGARWRRTGVGGVVLYQIDPAEFSALRSVTGGEMEARYNLDRFALLLHAARRALDAGLDPGRLSPFELRDRGFIDAVLAGGRLPPQLPGYGASASLRGSRAFVWLLARLARHAHIHYRAMAELGTAPAPELTTSGVWLGAWNGDAVAIGVVGDHRAVRAVIEKYGPKAAQVFYPYPLEYRANDESPDGQNLLLMVFPRAALAVLDQPTDTHRAVPSSH
ncbi:MAG TPA: hypothetical protein VNF28_03180 [Candidatus Binataceae bacterium]|nr:hypothetical protein [Candidatus Binataceae bacterium]